MLQRLGSVPDEDCARRLVDQQQGSATTQRLDTAPHLQQVGLFFLLAANKVEAPARLVVCFAAFSAVNGHPSWRNKEHGGIVLDDGTRGGYGTLEYGQESGGLVSLLDSDVRPSLLIQLHCFQSRGALVGGRRLGSVPDEVAETIAAQKAVHRRLAFQILARHGDSILPTDNIRVPAVELTSRHVIQKHFLVVQQVPDFGT